MFHTLIISEINLACTCEAGDNRFIVFRQRRRVTQLAALGNIDTTTGPTPVVDTSTISLDVISQTLDAMPAAEQVTR